MKKIYLESYDFFRTLPYPKLPKSFFDENLKFVKKLSFNEIKIINGYKNTCFAFFNKLLLHGKFPIALNMRNYSYKKDCILPYKKGLEVDKMGKDDIIKSIYYTINKFDNIFKKMNTLKTIFLYRGMKNRLTNKVITKMKDSCININKKSNENILSKINSDNAIQNLTNFTNKPKLTFDNLNVGDIFTYDAHQSTTFDPNVATNFLNFWGKDKYQKIFLKIIIKKEDKIPFIFLHDLFFSVSSKKEMLNKLKNWNKSSAGEFEILLPRNVQYKIISKKLYSIKRTPNTFENYFDSKKEHDDIMFLTLRVLPYEYPKKLNKNYFSKLPEYVISSK